MEFGRKPAAGPLSKLPDLTPERLHGLAQSPDIRVYLGLPFFKRTGLRGTLYPEGLSPPRYLSYYARQFNTLELNATHYSVPSAAQVRQWREQVPVGFLFCPKVPQDLSHNLVFRNPPVDAIDRFVDVIQGFEHTLGRPFIQFPQHFGRAQWPKLRDLLRAFSKSCSLAVELRHPSFFESGYVIPEVYEDLVSMGHSLVVTDTLGERDVVHSGVAQGELMIRFLAGDEDAHTRARIDAWASRISELASRGLRRVYLFAHHPRDEAVTALAQMWSQALKTHGLPTPIIKAPTIMVQQSLF